MCRLICTFIVHIWLKQVFSWHGSIITVGLGKCHLFLSLFGEPTCGDRDADASLVLLYLSVLHAYSMEKLDQVPWMKDPSKKWQYVLGSKILVVLWKLRLFSAQNFRIWEPYQKTYTTPSYPSKMLQNCRKLYSVICIVLGSIHVSALLNLKDFQNKRSFDLSSKVGQGDLHISCFQM